jgi:hypothetical protein
VDLPVFKTGDAALGAAWWVRLPCAPASQIDGVPASLCATAGEGHWAQHPGGLPVTDPTGDRGQASSAGPGHLTATDDSGGIERNTGSRPVPMRFDRAARQNAVV